MAILACGAHALTTHAVCRSSMVIVVTPATLTASVQYSLWSNAWYLPLDPRLRQPSRCAKFDCSNGAYSISFVIRIVREMQDIGPRPTTKKKECSVKSTWFRNWRHFMRILQICICTSKIVVVAHVKWRWMKMQDNQTAGVEDAGLENAEQWNAGAENAQSCISETCIFVPLFSRKLQSRIFLSCTFRFPVRCRHQSVPFWARL